MSELLLHVCCGPCASASIGFWRGRGLQPTGLFYNPNIHPLLEFRRRLTGAREVAEITRTALVEDLHYDPAEWFRRVLPELESSAEVRVEQSAKVTDESSAGVTEESSSLLPIGAPAADASYEGRRSPARCLVCIGLRLERAAAEARACGCSAFSTTLAISPYQDHEGIRAAGRAAEAAHDVEFVYEDTRLLYPESKKLSREWGIYRQKYCGCLLSEWERYRAPSPRGAGRAAPPAELG